MLDFLGVFSALSSNYFLIGLMIGNLNCLWWGCSVMSREGCVSLTGGGGGGDWDLEAGDGHRRVAGWMPTRVPLCQGWREGEQSSYHHI